MNKWLARILGIMIVAMTGLFFYDGWFSPKIPQGITKEPKTVESLPVADNKPEATKPVTPSSQEEKPTESISLTSLQDMESDNGAPVPVLSNPQGNPEQQTVATSAPVAETKPAPQPAQSSAQESANKAGIQLESLGNTQQTTTPAKTAPKTTPPKPSQQPVTSSGWLQAGSFGEKANAERLAANIRGKSLPAVVEQVTVNGKVYHRVYVGPVAGNRMPDTLKTLSAMGVSARQVNR